MQTNLFKDYVAPSCGAYGISLDDQLRTESRLNASFSQNAWANAQLSGCLPRPCRPPQKWPPTPGQGFIYPTLEKKQQELLDLGVATGCPETYDLESPYADGGQFSLQATARARRPVIDAVNPSECPPNASSRGNDVQYVQQGKGIAATIDNLERGDVASRVAARILGLPQPPPQYPQQRFAPSNGGGGDLGDDSASPSASPSVPAPSPGPYYREQCLLDSSDFNLGEVLPCTWNTLEGITYDIRHWSQLPRDSTTGKLSYIFGRDDRPFYIVIVVVAAILVILLLRALFFRGGGGGRTNGAGSASYSYNYPYQMYAQPQQQCPPAPPPQIVAVPIQVPAQWMAPVQLQK